MEIKLFSVIIPTCHRDDLLAKCLDCLKPGVQTLDASLYEVIVTDDGSQTNAKDFIGKTYPWVKWVAGPQKGPAANRNNGAKYANGEWLIFFDDDCLPDSNVLQAYENARLLYPKCQVFEGRIYADRPKQRMDEESPINETGGSLWSCNFGINKDLFWNIGAFDEDFPYAAMEDIDLHYRLKEIDVSPIFLKDATVCHPWRRITNAFIRCTRKETSIKIYLNKHPQERTRLNFKHFINVYFRVLVKSYIPGVFRYKFKGATTEGIRIAYYVKFGFATLK